MGLFRGGFVEHPSWTEAAQQSVTKIISLMYVNLVTPKAGAEHESFCSTNRPQLSVIRPSQFVLYFLSISFHLCELENVSVFQLQSIRDLVVI